MNGSRLEVSVYIVTAKRTALTNIKSALKISGIEVVKFVLDSYASALAVLDDQQKKFGAIVINLGATTTEFVYFKGNSIIFNGFIPVGSNHVTNDLSVMLHTPPSAAEKIKLEYGSLVRNYSPNNELGVTKVKIPRIGDEDSISEVALDYIQTIIHARVEEVLVLVKNKLKKSGLIENTGSGIVITGGMSSLDGIKKLTERIFEGIPISVTNPKNIKNGFMSFDEATMATIVGLLFYSLGANRSYQLDSSKKLIKPVKNDRIVEQKISITNSSNNNNHASEKPHVDNNMREQIEIKNNGTVLTPLTRDKKKGVSKFWGKVSEWF